MEFAWFRPKGRIGRATADDVAGGPDRARGRTEMNIPSVEVEPGDIRADLHAAIRLMELSGTGCSADSQLFLIKERRLCR